MKEEILKMFKEKFFWRCRDAVGLQSEELFIEQNDFLEKALSKVEKETEERVGEEIEELKDDIQSMHEKNAGADL